MSNTTKPSKELRLNCLVLDEDVTRIFTVKIRDTENVSALKEMIKAEKNRFNNIDADQLALWKVSIPVETDQHVETAISQPDEAPLWAVRTLSRIFANVDENKEHLHVLIRPPTVSLLRLNCLVLGDEATHAFSVKIAPTESVGVLKKMIKTKKSPQFNNVDADQLVLWQVPVDTDNISNLDLDKTPQLSPMKNLSRIFANVGVTEEHLHVLIRPPIVPPPIPESVSLLRLNCRVLDEDTSRIFTVEIPDTKNVSALKKMIKTKKSPQFDHIPADQLVLWEVTVGTDNISNLDLDKTPQLSPMNNLVRIFANVGVTEERLHVLIRAPPDGPNYGSASHISPAPLQLTGPDVSLRRMLTKAPYVGQTVSALHEYIISSETSFRQGAHYAKFFSIVQSSGTGKTRAMLDLGASDRPVLVFYANLRESTDNSGYPHRDKIICDMLSIPDFPESQQEFERRCCAFLTAVFQALRGWLTEVPKKSDWNEKLEAWRSISGIDDLGRDEFLGKVYAAYQRTTNDAESHESSLAGQRRMLSECAELAKALATFDDQQRWKLGKEMEKAPLLVLAFDEAHTLTPIAGKWGGVYQPAHILGRALNSCSQCDDLRVPIWTIFASTNSRISHYAAPNAMPASLRVLRGKKLFTPFVALGLDQFAKPLNFYDNGGQDKYVIKPSERESVISFGRPLWVSTSNINGNDFLDTFTRFAIVKLLKTERYDLSQINQAMAALSQRFGLDVAFSLPESISVVDDLIASHMAYCLGTTEDRRFKFTIYASEPFLSHAAATLLLGKPGDINDTPRIVSALKVLHQKALEGLLDLGAIGEMWVRIAMSLAKDLLVPPVPPGSAMITYCQAVPLIDFLESLLGPSFSWPSESKRVFEDLDAVVNFSHWVGRSANIAPFELGVTPEEFQKRHWVRTSAIQCAPLQPLIDNVIIWYSKKENCFGHILAQDKLAINNKAALKDITDRDQSIGLHTNNRPYIAIVFDIGLADSDAGIHSTWGGKTQDDRCLRIHVKGFTNDMYPFVDKIDGLRKVMDDLRFRNRVPPSSPYPKLRAKASWGHWSDTNHLRWEDQ